MHTALDGCIAANATCAGAAASAWLTYTTFCRTSPRSVAPYRSLTLTLAALGNATMEINFEAGFDLNATFTGSLNPQPSETGAPAPQDGNGGKGADGDNGAGALRRGGLATALSVLAAVAAVVV